MRSEPMQWSFVLMRWSKRWQLSGVLAQRQLLVWKIKSERFAKGEVRATASRISCFHPKMQFLAAGEQSAQIFPRPRQRHNWRTRIRCKGWKPWKHASTVVLVGRWMRPVHRQEIRHAFPAMEAMEILLAMGQSRQPLRELWGGSGNS
jgi:hypothetical protein